jgi:hypothetical protein
MKDEYKEMVCRVRFIDGVPAKTYMSDVEIVRCKDCKYYEEQDETIGTCLLTESGAHVKGYCSWAEVKDE